MTTSGSMRKLVCCGVALLVTTAILITVPLFAHQGIIHEDNSEAASVVKNECTFSDGSTISFGHKAMGVHQSGDDVWQAGKYAATAFRVSEQMQIPPLDNPINIPAGTYTLFVDPSKGEPWTLIVSKKTGKARMDYPGKQYDVGLTQMGFDDSFRPPVAKFLIGCTQQKDAPIFISMASDIHIAYAKIEAVGTRRGQTRILTH